jgi:multidrug efflux pump subunit AcrA (membrane-fusion protein)
MLQLKNKLLLPYSGYQVLVNRHGKVPVIIGLLFIFVSSVVLIHWMTNPTTDTSIELKAKTLVTTATALDYTADFSGALIGTAVAKTEATLLTERGGQVTSVPVTLGQFVPAGTIIAQFNNDSERAVLTQARGAYESALVSAKQSVVSITDAENRVLDAKRTIITAHNNAEATVTGIVTGTIDQFFANPNNAIPGLRINGRGNTDTLNQSRNTLRLQLQTWLQNTTTLTVDKDATEELRVARQTIQNTINMVNIFITIFQQERGDTQYSADDYRNFVTSFTQIRTTLTGLLNSLAIAESDLVSAEEGVTRARLSGGDNSSLASAQITQARGALQAAEANFNKTIIRTPISGTIATLAVRRGDFTNPQALVARITNTDGVEITAFVNSIERDYFDVGTIVLINGSATGTVSAISPNINPINQKIEMRITVSDPSILPGSTVSIALVNQTDNSITKTAPITIPITAVKFADTEGVVFVVENEILIARPVSLGEISGNMVTVLDGIERTTEFVVDARGKTVGEPVEVLNK